MKEIYCVKCRKKTRAEKLREVTLRNGRKATQGTCSVCGTKVFSMGGAK